MTVALAASVGQFVFVHAFNARRLSSLEPIRAKQRFVDESGSTPGIVHSVVCPTGFFNDMAEFLRMASRGSVYLIGDGQRKINPIHGADLAKVCVDAVAGAEADIDVGGPVTSRTGRSPNWPFGAGEAAQDSSSAGVAGEGRPPARPPGRQIRPHAGGGYDGHHAGGLRGPGGWDPHAEGVLRAVRPDIGRLMSR